MCTDRLLERFENLEGHPAFVVSPTLDLECIILRDKLDGSNNTDIPYTDTPKTERFRNNLRNINECLIKHWADLRIKDSEVEKLAQRVLQDPDKEPIDLSRRILRSSLEYSPTVHLIKVVDFIEVGGKMFQVNIENILPSMSL